MLFMLVQLNDFYFIRKFYFIPVLKLPQVVHNSSIKTFLRLSLQKCLSPDVLPMQISVKQKVPFTPETMINLYTVRVQQTKHI